MDLSEQQKPLLKQTIKRRSQAAVKALREQMQELEAQGKSRKAISLILGISAAQVTQTLGAKRAYRRRN